MKKYKSLGELLIDYRKENELSQFDFAAQVNVDVRTVQRWEKEKGSQGKTTGKNDRKGIAGSCR